MAAFNDKILEVRATNFRTRYGIGSDAPIDFKKLLPVLEVLTVFKPLSDAFSGMALKTQSGLFIMVNTNNQIGRQRFTIGHELYHLFVQEDFSFKLCKTGKFNKKDKEEYNADVFSSLLLMPETGILKLIPEIELSWGKSISLATIIKLEQHFGVSRRALLIRLERLGLIKFSDYERHLEGVIKSAREYGYSTELYNKPKEKFYVLGNYGIKVKELFDSGLISETHYHSLMHDINVNVDAKPGDDEQEPW